MAPDAIWSGSATLTVTTEGGNDVPIAGLQDMEVIPGYEHEELFTLDSTFRDNVKRFEHNVSVDITYAKFDLTAAQEWLGGEGATATSSQDSNDPELFTIEDVSKSADGTYERTTVVEKVHFPEFPILSKSYGEFEEWDLSGTGRKLSKLEDTSAV